MNFNSVEFDRIKSEAGYNSFMLSPKKWIEKTQAIGIISKGIFNIIYKIFLQQNYPNQNNFVFIFNYLLLIYMILCIVEYFKKRKKRNSFLIHLHFASGFFCAKNF